MSLLSKAKKAVKKVASTAKKPLSKAVQATTKPLAQASAIKSLVGTVVKAGGAGAVAPGLQGMVQRKAKRGGLAGAMTKLSGKVGRLGGLKEAVPAPEATAQKVMQPTALAPDLANAHVGAQAQDVAPAGAAAKGVLTPGADAAAEAEKKRQRMRNAAATVKTVLG